MNHITREFVTAGDAIFTIETPDAGHYTFKVEHVPANDRYPESYFVKLLTGPDNRADYTYLGKLDPFTSETRTTAKSQRFAGSFPLNLLNRTLARVWGNDHAAYERHGYKTHHEGACGRCGRALTVPESIESGFGPECVQKVFGCRKPRKEKAAAAAAFDAILNNVLGNMSERGEPETAEAIREMAFGA